MNRVHQFHRLYPIPKIRLGVLAVLKTSDKMRAGIVRTIFPEYLLAYALLERIRDLDGRHRAVDEDLPLRLIIRYNIVTNTHLSKQYADWKNERGPPIRAREAGSGSGNS